MLSIREIMTPDLFTLETGVTLAVAKQLMKTHRIRHILIIDVEKRLIGLITQRDILAADKTGIFVSDAMRRALYTISQTADMRAAALMLQKHKIGSLPVLQGEKLVGIITDSDYVGLAINLLEQMEAIEPDDVDDYDAADATDEV